MPTIVLTDKASTQEFDLGNSQGMVVHNLTTKAATFYVDYKNNGQWSAITGKKTVAVGTDLTLLTADLKQNHVRIGAEGEEQGNGIVRVTY